MITKEQIQEIRTHLENTKNPLFFFDNDADGLCSFLILQRFIGKGKGIAIKSFPGLNESYAGKVKEFNSDYVFVLDRSLMDKDFIEEVKALNVEIVCIDHHNVVKPEIENYYNGFNQNEKINQPTSYICYKIAERKEDLWLALAGCVSDGFTPEFLEDFKRKYPDLIDLKSEKPFDITFKTKLGKIIEMMSYCLLDKTSNVVSLIKFLIKTDNPNDFLEENSKTNLFHSRYSLIDKKVKKIADKAENFIDKEKNILFFTYSGDMSVSQYVSNRILYKHPDLVIAVGYVKGNYANFSFRWKKNIRTAMIDALKNIEGATGGGHEHATGAKITSDKIQVLKENLIREVEKVKN